MGRVYTSTFQNVAVSAVQDLWEITAPSTGMVRILSAHVGQESDAGDAQAEMLRIGITRYASSGSGGAVDTPRPNNVGHAAFGGTVERNNTTQGGTPTEVFIESWNVQIGWHYNPIPEEMFWVPPSGIIAIELAVAPNDALTINSFVTFEEID